MLDETHVGLQIMAERAQRIGAVLEVISTPSHGTSVILTLPKDRAITDTSTNPVLGRTVPNEKMMTI